MKLYRWQQDCLTAWRRNNCRGIANVATGAGKTMLALAAIQSLRAEYPDLMVKVVVHTLPLAMQWMSLLQQQADTPLLAPGFYGGGRHDDPDRPVMVYIINSARTALAGHMRRAFSMGRHVLLICDECHHCKSPQNRRIFDFMDGAMPGGLYHSLGLSATPFDGGVDDDILRRSLGSEVYHYDVDSAVADGVLSPYVVCDVAASFNSSELSEYAALSARLAKCRAMLLSEHPHLKKLPTQAFFQTVHAMARRADMSPDDPAAGYVLTSYQRKLISTQAQERLRCALLLLGNMHADDRIIVFSERIEQAEALRRMAARALNMPCALYHSGLNAAARQRNMDLFRTGEARVMIACRCLDEGIDVPQANVGIVMSASAVPRQRLQRLGRILRNAPDKSAACLYHIYIRESADDQAYLPGMKSDFSLRLYPTEQDFSCEVYEYACAELLRRAQDCGYTSAQLAELRGCLMRGLTRGDWLLPPAELTRRVHTAKSRRQANDDKAMLMVSREVTTGSEHDT